MNKIRTFDMIMVGVAAVGSIFVIFGTILMPFIILFLMLTGPASGEVLERISPDGEWSETLYTGDDVVCEPAEKYGKRWDEWGRAHHHVWGLATGNVMDPETGIVYAWRTFANDTTFETSDSYIIGGVRPAADGSMEICLLGHAVRAGDPV